MTGPPSRGEHPDVPPRPSVGSPGTIVDVEKVSRRFRLAGEEIWAVRDVSIRVERGEFTALMGRSGSGKTTLLNLIAGLDRADTGTVYLAGEEITHATERQLQEIRRHKVGFVFQSFGLLPLLSAYENVEIALRIAGVGLHESRARATELLHTMDLHARRDHRPYELSGGEQQRVAIARALANEPSLVVADEPTGELDSSNARAIFGLLCDLAHNKGVTILTATHDRTVLVYADRVEEMADGRLLERHERGITASDPQHVAADSRAGARGLAGRKVPRLVDVDRARCTRATGDAGAGRRQHAPRREADRLPAAAGQARSLGPGLRAARSLHQPSHVALHRKRALVCLWSTNTRSFRFPIW